MVHPGAELYGSDRVFLDAAVGFAARGYDVRVVLPEAGALREKLAEEGIEVQLDEAFVLRKSLMKPKGWPALVTGLWKGRRALRTQLREFRPDAVYVSTITLPLWSWIPPRHNIVTMVHVHEAEQSAPGLVRKGLYYPLRHASVIAVNSEFSKNVMLRSLPSVRDRADIVWNPVPGPADPVPPRAEIEGSFRVAYVGRLSPRKGVDLAVSAVGALRAAGRDVSLDLIGAVFTGYEWYEQELGELVAQLDLHDHVRFLGFQSSVWDALSEADVIVVPSRLDEPFGNTAVEAALVERPLVVSNTSGLREATAGVPTAVRVEPDDAVALERAIWQVHEQWPDLVAQVGEAARIVRERHDVEAFRDRLAASLTRAIAAR